MTNAIVIGAGFGGLAIASLLQKRGIHTILLEAHSVVGGCASFFRRKNFIFDVGATTLSGVLPHQPIGRLFKELNIQPKFLKLDPGMIIVQNGKELIRKENLEEWISECEEKFGIQGQRKFWKKIHSINQSAWDFLSENKNFTNSSILDFVKLVKSKNLLKFPLFITTFKTIKNLLNEYKIYNLDFEKFLNEQLLITTQSLLHEAPLLTASMGLAYPSETYYPWGGMYKIAQEILNSFLENEGEFYKNTEVIKIEQRSKGYEIITKGNKKFFTNLLICNLPIWNIPKLTSSPIAKYFQKLLSKYPNPPAAFVLNFGVDLNSPLPTCYYQIHATKQIPYCNANAFFVSFSHFEDRERASEKQAAVTISIHTDSKYWYNLNELEYRQRKEIVSTAILEEFDLYFKNKLGVEKYFFSSGTPKTFEEYTLRYKGYVGGIPHTVRPHFFQMPSSVTPFSGFYVVGDTVFPGQGTPAVIHASLSLCEKILKSNAK